MIAVQTTTIFIIEKDRLIRPYERTNSNREAFSVLDKVQNTHQIAVEITGYLVCGDLE